MRRATIDRINARYHGSSALSPTGFAARTSAIRSVSPVVPAVGTSVYSPTVISTGPAVIPAPTSVIGTRTSTIGRGTTVTGAPVFASTLAPVATNTVIRSSRVAVSGLRKSVVTTPPVYEVVEHPPVYEVVTTPPKVYEIVTPIVDVTPDTVITRRVEVN